MSYGLVDPPVPATVGNLKKHFDWDFGSSEPALRFFHCCGGEFNRYWDEMQCDRCFYRLAKSQLADSSSDPVEGVYLKHHVEPVYKLVTDPRTGATMTVEVDVEAGTQYYRDAARNHNAKLPPG